MLVLVALVLGCSGVAYPTNAARTNVLLSFASDWDCLQSLRSTCERGIAGDLGHIFARYDIGFWTASERDRIDGITVFFETSDPELWGANAKTVGWSVVRCKPRTSEGLIVGAAAIFQCGDTLEHGPAYCAGVAAHEIGHLLGLEHVAEDNYDMMNAIYRGQVAFGRTPKPTDDGQCRSMQNDSELLLAALGEARGIR